MKRMGAAIMTSEEFEQYGRDTVKRMSQVILDDIEKEEVEPEPVMELGFGNSGWVDLW